MRNSLVTRSAVLAMASVVLAGAAVGAPPAYDLVIRGGEILDGSGKAGVIGDLAVKGDRIAYVGPHAPGRGGRDVDARGKVVAPGFINILSHSEDSLIADGRALSEIRQGVTLDVMGEGDSMGPLNPRMKALALKREGDVDPTPAQLKAMRTLVREAMEDGAMGVASALIYAPGAYSETDELVALTTEAGRCGGIYISHMRSEGDRLLEAIDELIEISRRSDTPAEIFHLKQSGRDNWGKLDAVIAKVEAARAKGQRITADMYLYPAGSTGFDAAQPTWVQAGGVEKWIERLRDPAIRARVLAEMGEDHPKGFENLFRQAGADATLLVGFKNPKLKPLTGKTLAEVAKSRGTSPEDTVLDLVIEDGSRVQVVYFLMSEANVARQTALPWVGYGSDAAGMAPEGIFLQSSTHPRAYGNFVRVLGKYARDEKTLSLPEAVRKLSAFPAHNLGLHERGMLKAGWYADVVVFDPKTVTDHATFEKPQQLATGVSDVLVNGQLVLKDGEPTGAHAGRVVRGRGWTGWKDGGCRKSPRAWTW